MTIQNNMIVKLLSGFKASSANLATHDFSGFLELLTDFYDEVTMTSLFHVCN